MKPEALKCTFIYGMQRNSFIVPETVFFLMSCTKLCFFGFSVTEQTYQFQIDELITQQVCIAMCMK